MLPLAPGLLRITTGCAQLSLNFCPIARVTKSVVPPGAYGTMMSICLLGYGCARAAVTARHSAPAHSADSARSSVA